MGSMRGVYGIMERESHSYFAVREVEGFPRGPREIRMPDREIHHPITRRTMLMGTAAAAVTAAGTGLTVAAAPPAAAAAPNDPAKNQDSFHSVPAELFRGNFKEHVNHVRYHSFRIPAIVTTPLGTQIAFAEGRVCSDEDWGNINLVYKRRPSSGKWSSLKQAAGKGPGTWGNPTPLVDTTGTIWLFMNWNADDRSQDGKKNPCPPHKDTAPIRHWGERRVYAMMSSDDGENFTGIHGEPSPTDMTDKLGPPKPLLQEDQKSWSETWAFDAIGPGNGICTGDGTLVIPARHRNIYSTDQGLTWNVQLLGYLTSDGSTYRWAGVETGESTITQLANGKLYRNDRPATAATERAMRRQVARGSISGGFDGFRSDPKLHDSICEASVLQYNSLDKPTRTIFLNPDSTIKDHRAPMRVRISYDNAGTWPVSRRLDDCPLPGHLYEGGYSSMAKTHDNRIGAPVEASDSHRAGKSIGHRSIIYREFNLSWILKGKYDVLACPPVP